MHKRLMWATFSSQNAVMKARPPSVVEHVEVGGAGNNLLLTAVAGDPQPPRELVKQLVSPAYSLWLSAGADVIVDESYNLHVHKKTWAFNGLSVLMRSSTPRSQIYLACRASRKWPESYPCCQRDSRAPPYPSVKTARRQLLSPSMSLI